MEHRHLEIESNEWNVAVVHSIWERGLEKDISALIREVRKNTMAADAVKNAIPHSKVYGWPKFFRMYMEKIDKKNERNKDFAGDFPEK